MNPKAILASLLLSLFTTLAAPAQNAASSPAEDLRALVTQIGGKLREGRTSATDLAPDLAAFDALRAKYHGQKSEEVAQILYMQATLYGEVLGDLERTTALLEQLKREFPGTQSAANADRTLASLEARAKLQQVKDNLVGRPAPELNFTWASREGLKNLSGLKGKIVVLDFWATWCGPCISSFPQVRELTAHYRDADVEVVGVTSLQGYVMGLSPPRIDTRNDPRKEMALMADFIKAKDITWSIAFSQEPVFNPEYGVSGIPHMAIIAPDGTVRHTGLHPAMPHAQKVEMIDALLKEFGRKLPAASTGRG